MVEPPLDETSYEEVLIKQLFHLKQKISRKPRGSIKKIREAVTPRLHIVKLCASKITLRGSRESAKIIRNW